MILDTVNHQIQVILGGAKAANDSPIVVDFVDIDTTTFTPGCQAGVTNGVTAQQILAAPASGHQRKVNAITLVNADTAAIAVTIRLNISAVLYNLFTCTLGVGEKLVWTDAIGWSTYDTAGSMKQVTSGTGVWLGTYVKTSGSTHTTGPRTTTLFVRMVGGGGGGGGCTSLAAAAAGAGGGGGGGYAEKTFTVTPSTNYTYAIGAAGAGASGAAGGNGGNSTFTVGGTTVTAFGGVGGPVGTAATTLVARAGGAGGAVSTNGDVNRGGEPGVYGVSLVVATPIVASGHGGNGPFGGGGVGIVAVGNGNAATGYGAGGGGAATGASAVRTGGNGTAGVIVIDEYA